MTYILTESHPNRGCKGLLVDQNNYLSVPWFDRAIFELVNEDSEQFYFARLNIKCGNRFADYLLVDARHVEKLLCEFALGNHVRIVQAELNKKCSVTLTSYVDDCVYLFTPIIS